jgi:hypothetical protein
MMGVFVFRAMFACALWFVVSPAVSFASVDCSEAYGATSKCERVACDPKYQTFLGTWKGPFESYVRELSSNTEVVYRPYNNVVVYSEQDCLLNIANGDRFIIGRKTDDYPAFHDLPAKQMTGLLITGKRADGTSFLRTVDSESGVVDYALEYQNSIANISVWSFHFSGTQNNPELNFTTIDAQDFNDHDMHKRNVTVTMEVGPKSRPVWSGVVVRGYHTLQR